MIDLIKFPGAYISLSAIQGIEDETDENGQNTGVVTINYGAGLRISFEGSADDVMGVIGAWQRDASTRAAAAAGASYGTPTVLSVTA
jgi:hypothetical protein